MELPEQVGRYQVEREVARGGMGVVLRGRSSEGSPVAVKLLLAGPAATPLQRRRVLTEVQSLLRLRHPHVVQLLDAGEHQGVPYLVMEWIEGETLDARLRREGPLDPPAAVELVRRLALALEHCHAQGVLHRDLKPANVLLRASDGAPLLTDFGLSKDADDERSRGSTLVHTTAGHWLGTPGWWPPEQARGELAAIGPRSDVYGLGALLYGALTGRAPQEGSSLPALLDALERPVAPPSRYRPGLPAWLDRVCARSLAADPAARPESAGALARELEPGGGPAQVTPAGLRWAGLMAAVVVLVGVALAAAVLDLGAPVPVAPVAGPDALTGPTVDALLLAAERRLAAGDPGGARAEVDRALSLDPRSGRALRTRALLYRVQGDLVGARADCERALEATPDDSGLWCHLGIYRSELGDLQGALAALDRALELDPDLASAWHNRGVVHQRREDPGRARADYDRAIELDPELADAYGCRGSLSFLEGALQAARADLDRAIELEPGYAKAYRNRGLLREEQGDRIGARADYDEAIRLGPRDDGALCDRGALLCDLGELDAARADYDRALRLAPRSLAALCGRAWTRSLQGDLTGALADYELCLELAPGDPRSETVRVEAERLRARLSVSR